jgi:TetR/AcrR family transcriptional repressor of lmrAB and yxaGH operons
VNETLTGTRDRLIAAMSRALQRGGMRGTGLSELLAIAKAPKGVLYHHFPGGKSQLTVAAIEASASRILARLDEALADNADPLHALQAWMGKAQQRLSESGFDCGCPLATVALESTAHDTEIRAALSKSFGAIRARIAESLQCSGMPAAKAEGLAALIVAGYEGGLLQARVQGSLRPMQLAMNALIALIGSGRRGAQIPGGPR